MLYFLGGGAVKSHYQQLCLLRGASSFEPVLWISGSFRRGPVVLLGHANLPRFSHPPTRYPGRPLTLAP